MRGQGRLFLGMGWAIPLRRAVAVTILTLMASASLAAVIAPAAGPSSADSASGRGGGRTLPLLPTESTALNGPTVASPSPAAPHMSFVENQGQAGDSQVLYYQQGRDVKVGFTPSGLRFVVSAAPSQLDMSLGPQSDGAETAGADRPGASVFVSFEGSAPTWPTPLERAKTTTNFFVGSDPSQWLTDVPSYETLAYRGLWPGIDLVFRATAQGPKYEVVAAPGSDLSAVRLHYEGAARVSVDEAGSLAVLTAAGEVRDSAPTGSEAGRPLACAFVARGEETAGFSCPSWSGAGALTIDPVIYSTYLGVSGGDYGRAAVVDAAGHGFVTGETSSGTFPTTSGAFDTTSNGGYDAFILKMSADGTSIDWGTFFGGGSNDYPRLMAFGPNGSIYVSGYTQSGNFPTSSTAYQQSLAGSVDAFVLGLDACGCSLLFSTYLGGTSADYGNGIAVDANGTIYTAGYTSSTTFPVTTGSNQTTYRGGQDGFVAELNANASARVFVSYLGGTSVEYILGVGVDASGQVVVAGYTGSTNFPTTSGALRTSLVGSYDAFLTKFSADGATLAYSTYFGGSNTDYLAGMTLDSNDRVYITGYTYSTDYPTSAGAPYSSASVTPDAFVTRFNANATLSYSTYLPGSNVDYGQGIAATAAGDAIVVGYTSSTNFPVSLNAHQSSLSTAPDAFVTRIDPAGTSINYSTFLGGTSTDYGLGVGVNANVTIIATGYTFSTNFPTTTGAYDTSLSTAPDAFVTRIEPRWPRITVLTDPPGLQLGVGGNNVTSPFSLTCTASTTVYAISPQGGDLTRFVWSSWSDGGSRIHNVACSSDVTVVATFRQETNFTLDSRPGGATMLIDGSNYTLPVSFWWSPSENHTLQAVPTFTVIDRRLAFANWSDGEANISRNITAASFNNVSAQYEVSHFLVRVATEPPGLDLLVDGLLTPTPVRVWWDAASQHTLDSPNVQDGPSGTRYVFDRWSSGASQAHAVDASGPINLTAFFHVEYEVILVTQPSDLSLIVDGALLPTPVSFWWANGTSHDVAIPPDLQEIGDTRYVFDRWTDVAPPNRSLRADGARSLTAVYAPAAFLSAVTTDPEGLQVSVDGAQFASPALFWWTVGSDHNVRAISPQTGVGSRYTFYQWSDRLQVTHIVTANAPVHVSAAYVSEFEVTIVTSPPGLTVVVDGLTFDTPHSEWWKALEGHRVGVGQQAATTPTTRYTFANWSDSAAQNHSLNVSAPLGLTAFFQPQYKLTLSSPFVIPQCDRADCWYDRGATASFGVSSPRAGPEGTRYVFREWIGDLAATTTNATVLMDGPKEVQGAWDTEYFVKVNTTYANATGSGWYLQGTVANVTVSPTQVDDEAIPRHFVGWTGSIISTSPSLEFAVDTPKTLTAIWEIVQATPAPPPEPVETTPPVTQGADLTVPGAAAAAGAAAVAILFLVARSRRQRREEDDLSAPRAAPASPSTPRSPAPIGGAARPAGQIKAQVPPKAKAPPPAPVPPAPKVPLAPPAPPPAKKAVRPVRVAKPAEPAAAAPPPALEDLGKEFEEATAPAALPTALPEQAEGPAKPSAPTQAPCPSCGEPVEVGWAACPACGLDLVWN